ncbi:MAG: phosphoribosylglycinamide formyltransferase [Ignavibacteria bacterium]
MASGRGSNLKSVIYSQKSKKIKSKVILVISNNSNSGALKIALKNKIPAFHMSEKLFKSQKEFVNELLNLLKKFKIDLIVLAGYMKMLNPEIVKKYRNRILNIHPSILPLFCGAGMYGLKVHQAVIEYGCKVSGASVHIVDEGYDTGPIVLQRTLKVSENDTALTLQKKVLKLEHKLFPEAIRLFETKKFNLNGRKVYFT